MPDETSAERTNASDSSINDAFDLAEAEYAGHQTADKAPKTEPTKEVAAQEEELGDETEDLEAEEETEGEAADKAGEDDLPDEDLEALDDTEELSDESAIDTRIEKAVKDLPEDKRGPVTALIEEYRKGTEKIVTQAKEEKAAAEKVIEIATVHTQWGEALANPEAAPIAIQTIIDRVMEATKLPLETLLGDRIPKATVTTGPELLMENIEDWASYGYDSPGEMRAAIKLHQQDLKLAEIEAKATKAEKARQDEALAAREEAETKESRAKIDRANAEWNRLNAPAIINRIAAEQLGFKVTADEVRAAIGDARPKKLSEAVKLVQAHLVDKLLHHVRVAAASETKPNRRELPRGTTSRGKPTVRDYKTYTMDDAVEEALSALG